MWAVSNSQLASSKTNMTHLFRLWSMCFVSVRLYRRHTEQKQCHCIGECPRLRISYMFVCWWWLVCACAHTVCARLFSQWSAHRITHFSTATDIAASKHVKQQKHTHTRHHTASNIRYPSTSTFYSIPISLQNTNCGTTKCSLKLPHWHKHPEALLFSCIIWYIGIF